MIISEPGIDRNLFLSFGLCWICYDFDDAKFNNFLMSRQSFGPWILWPPGSITDYLRWFDQKVHTTLYHRLITCYTMLSDWNVFFSTMVFVFVTRLPQWALINFFISFCFTFNDSICSRTFEHQLWLKILSTFQTISL